MQGGCTPKSLQQKQAIQRAWAEAFAGPSIRKTYHELRGGWEIEPSVGRVVNGVADGMDRIAAIGNGQVPRVAAAAFAILAEQLMTANDLMSGRVKP
jgi:hypothetical protein